MTAEVVELVPIQPLLPSRLPTVLPIITTLPDVSQLNYASIRLK